MHALVIVTFLTATLAEFLSTSTKGPGIFKLIPEMLSVLITIGVTLQGVRRGFGMISSKYWFVFGALAVIIVCGVLTNGEGSGPVVAGARYYLRAIPLFILPAVYVFSEKQLKQQMLLILAVGLIQVPIACYQRWVIYSAGRFSGDDVYGSLMESGILSIFLICIVLILTGQLLRKRLSWTWFIPLFFVLLLPTTINETKVTVVILPLGLLTTIVAAAPPGRKLPIAFGGLGLLVAFAAILIPVYDFMNAHSRYKQGRNIEDFFTDQKLITQYMETQKRGAALGMKRDIRRGDAIKVPLQYLEKDPIRMAFGLGMGNASHSNLGPGFTGDYNGLFDKFLITAFTTFLLEVGVFGVSLIFALYWFIWRDTLAVAKLDDGLIGALAAGWIGVVALIPFATFYAPIQTYASISYLFWYFSGVIVARRSVLTLEVLQARENLLPAVSAAVRRPANASVGFVSARNNQHRLD